ncbi:MAG: DUF456 domain-containing protein [Bacteroidales bacterium]|nr:DUF456 domain-containing protein [Bacteroidales bacterium]
MDITLIIIGSILLLAGLAGCLLPVLPGPPLAYGSLLLLQFTEKEPFSVNFLVIWAIVTTIVVLADYYIPIWGTKRFGGTKGGTWGATIGLVLGLFLFPPFGIIIGPFVGAYLGELINGQDNKLALRSAIGSFIGFLAGTMMKLGVVIIMGFYFIRALI